MHILLPEPLEPNTTRPPESYASTGLPLFINNLIKAGADKNRLKTTISGGSFSTQGVDHNVDFDTGGMITEIVLQILRNERISIIRSETNGYFGARLSLNTETWDATIQPIIPKSHKTVGVFKKPTVADIELAISQVRPIPQIALKIIKIIRDSYYDMRDLADEIHHDQVIGAKVLRFCNSPIVGLR